MNGKWSTFGTSDATVSVHDSLLQIKQASQASYKLAGAYQTLPSGDWDAVALVGLKSENSSNYAAGGALFETDGEIEDVRRSSGGTTVKIITKYDEVGKMIEKLEYRNGALYFTKHYKYTFDGYGKLLKSER